MHRHQLLLICLILISSFNKALAQESNGNQAIFLWKNLPPNGPGPQEAERVSEKGSYTEISRPRIVVYRPEHPNGAAMLVISGGGYAHIESGKESGPAAAWLQAHGITAFELIYRLPGEGWTSNDVSFQDGQRAMRLIRSKANEWGIDPNRIGIMGFSAGGHLAGMIATQYDRQFYNPIDRIDEVFARPNFTALIYPVITMMPPFDHTHSEKVIIGTHPSRSQEKAYSVELHVNENTPPTFLAQALDDPISNVENSKLMFNALQQNKIPSEIQLFPSGGHGWGLGSPGTPEYKWPKLFEEWAKQLNIWH